MMALFSAGAGATISVMPYQWTPAPGTAPRTCLILWPHRSLPRWGFVLFIGITCGMLLVPLLALLGTGALWGLLPFLAVAVAAVWWAISRSYRSGETREELCIDPERAVLIRSNPDGREQRWQANSYWVEARIYPKGGPVPQYITLRGEGREVELGAFLSEPERARLIIELTTALSHARAGG